MTNTFHPENYLRELIIAIYSYRLRDAEVTILNLKNNNKELSSTQQSIVESIVNWLQPASGISNLSHLPPRSGLSRRTLLTSSQALNAITISEYYCMQGDLRGARDFLRDSISMLKLAACGSGSNPAFICDDYFLMHLEDIAIHAQESLCILKRALAQREDPLESVGFVLGMHRSGTSATTKFLHHLGYDLPERLLPSNDGNSKGYHESEYLYRINSELLQEISKTGSWNTSHDLTTDSFFYPAITQWKQGFATFLGTEETGRHIAIKDPRLCLLTALIPEWIHSSIITWLFYLPLRAPLCSAVSLRKRGKTDLKSAIKTWIRYTLSAEKITRNLPRMYLPFNSLAQDSDAWKLSVLEFASSHGVLLEPRVESEEPIDISLIHENESNLEICGIGELEAELALANDIYQELCKGVSATAKVSYAKLDALALQSTAMLL
jgi:hypothetical protein